MKVLIPGIDGYLGWTLAQHLTHRGHEVIGIDNFSRRRNVAEMGSWSAIPIKTMDERLSAFEELFKKKIEFYPGDLMDYHFVEGIMKRHKPDGIVHLGEQPSAPFSMIDVGHATDTQTNNVVGTLNLLFAMHNASPKTHLVKLGTMGEYGAPDMVIPEGFFDIEYRGRKDTLPFPRQPPSYYHLSKVHDSANIMFACKVWGLSSTNIMQGVVYGTRADKMDDPRLATRFDFDEAFGTAVNRYCAQAVIGHKMTPFGLGEQKRGFIALRDSMQCLTLALENPQVGPGYRVFNQFDEVYNVTQLAEEVAKAAKKLGIDAEVGKIENPRVEAEKHYYNPDSKKLRKLGFKPTKTLPEELNIMLTDLLRHRNRIEAKRDRIDPRIYWRTGYEQKD